MVVVGLLYIFDTACDCFLNEFGMTLRGRWDDFEKTLGRIGDVCGVSLRGLWDVF